MIVNQKIDSLRHIEILILRHEFDFYGLKLMVKIKRGKNTGNRSIDCKKSRNQMYILTLLLYGM